MDFKHNNNSIITFPDISNESHILYYGVNGFGITWSYLLVHVILFFVGLTGLLLNTFCFITLRNKESWRDISVIFITNLTCSDIIMDITCIYIVIYNLVHYKNYYECAFRLGLVIGIAWNSILQLFALTLDRYFKILYPYKYVRIFNEGLAKKFCAANWIASGTLSLLPIFGVRRSPIWGEEYCSFFGVLTDEYIIVVSVCMYVILACMLFCYMRIISTACTQTKQCAKNHIHVKHLWWKPTKTVLVLIIFYVFCWLPLSVCIFLHLTNGYPKNFTDDMKGTTLAYGSSFVFLDTIANPVIYALNIKTVRQKFRFAKSICLRQNKSETLATQTIQTSRSIPQITVL